MRERRPTSVQTKLLASHLMVGMTVGVVLVIAMLVIAPWLHQSFMDDAADPGHLMRFEVVSSLFRKSLVYSLTVAVVVALVVAVVASLWLSRHTSRPIHSMVEATRRIAGGRYSERVSVRSEDELGVLAGSLNAMAESLESTERQRVAFIADLSHELRTPLASLRGYLEGLRDGVIPPHQANFELLLSESERMRRLVDDLQELSQAQAGTLVIRPRPLDLATTARRVTDSMSPLFADRRVTLRSELPPECPVNADPDRLVQVMSNLLTNALQHTPPGGAVRVTASETGSGDVRVYVCDNGTGIDQAELDQVFERFYRVDRSRSRSEGGAGLGLAISRALVESMGGSIRAESPGRGFGTTFTFTIPSAKSETIERYART